MKKVRVAQIGTSKNSHGSHIWRSIKKQTDIFDIAGFALPENEREKFPRQVQYFDGFREMTVEEIMADPTIEAVVIETEEIYLTKYALLAAKAGKHIHMEKPGGVDLKEFEELIALVKSKKLTFTTGYMYRFNPKIREVLDTVQSGKLGEIYCVEAHMDCRHLPEVRQWLDNFPGGMMFFLGCHLIDLIYQIQGEPLEVIPLNCSTGADGITAEDYGMAVLKYKNGVSFAKACGNEMGGFTRRQLVICGSKGTVEINPLEVLADEGQYTVATERYETSWHATGTTTKSQLHDRYDAMVRNFALVLRKQKENPYSYDYELGLYRLIQKCCGRSN